MDMFDVRLFSLKINVCPAVDSFYLFIMQLYSHQISLLRAPERYTTLYCKRGIEEMTCNLASILYKSFDRELWEFIWSISLKIMRLLIH